MIQGFNDDNAAAKNNACVQESAPLPGSARPPQREEAIADAEIPQIPPLDMIDYDSFRDSGGFQLKPEDSPIKVTFRTRDGTRSPYLTPIQANPFPEFDFIPDKPYGPSYSGTSSPAFVSTPHQCTPRFPTFSGLAERQEEKTSCAPPYPGEVKEGDLVQQKQQPPPSPQQQPSQEQSPASSPAPETTPLEELPEQVVHRGLHGRCRFIPFPSGLSAEASGSGNGVGKTSPLSTFSSEHGNLSGGAWKRGGSTLCTLFVGQVRFETTAAELLWMIHRVSGACVCHLESRGAGCYIIYCRSDNDLQLIRRIHKRVLFDIGGVWFARTAEEIDALCEYVALEAPVLSRKAHLPRDSIVIEEHKVDAQGLSAARHHSMKLDQHSHMFMQYPTQILSQRQALPAIYTSYSSPYVTAYQSFIPAIAMPNQTNLPPPPPYNS